MDALKLARLQNLKIFTKARNEFDGNENIPSFAEKIVKLKNDRRERKYYDRCRIQN